MDEVPTILVSVPATLAAVTDEVVAGIGVFGLAVCCSCETHSEESCYMVTRNDKGLLTWWVSPLKGPRN